MPIGHVYCRPVLFGLNGANVESHRYSTLATLLANKGYVIVLSDYYHPLPPSIPGPNLTEACPKGAILAASAALISTLLDYAMSTESLSDPGSSAPLQGIQTRGIVLLAHSFGAATAIAIMANECLDEQDGVSAFHPVSLCEAYQPLLYSSPKPAANVTEFNPLVSGAAEYLNLTSMDVGNATFPADSDANTTVTAANSMRLEAAVPVPPEPSPKGIIRGAVVYEGYKTSEPPQFTPRGVNIPAGTFLLYLSGQYGAPRVEAAFNSSGNIAAALGYPGSCVGFAAFDGLNHYGMVDWQGPGAQQITPCGVAAPSDPPGLNVSRIVQNDRLKGMATLVDEFVRAAVLGDQAMQSVLLEQAAGIAAAQAENVTSNSTQVEGYKLQLKPYCFS